MNTLHQSQFPSPQAMWQGVLGKDAASQQTECFSATIAVVSSYLQNNPYPVAKLTDLIREVYSTLSALHPDPNAAVGVVAADQAWQAPKSARSATDPAVPVDQSIEDDYLVCLEDGKRVRLLKRHLNNVYGMTPDQYRRKWGLSEDYPMVAPSLSKRRSEVAANVKPYLGRQKKRAVRSAF